jgi:hypothetical protein
MKTLSDLPEFRALEAVVRALAPLEPEGRRKVIEAVHALLPVSAGKAQGRDKKKSGKK